MRTIRLTLAYDGTHYVGWQRQPNGSSIQALVETAVSAIEGRPVVVAGAGRTDSGVHALGQVASLRLTHSVPVADLLRALNARLPHDIRVLAADEMPEGFHARFSATGKTYRYRILAQPAADPFERHVSWHVPRPLDVEAMQIALAALRGAHDFAAFQAAGSGVAQTRRTITRADLDWTPPGGMSAGARVLAMEVSADGFLRHMVRNIAGTLVEVGLGRREASSIEALLDGRDRRAAGVTAPPQGLCLVSVSYDAPPASAGALPPVPPCGEAD